MFYLQDQIMNSNYLTIFFALKDLVGTEYYCPACKAKFNFELSDSEKWESKLK